MSRLAVVLTTWALVALTLVGCGPDQSYAPVAQIVDGSTAIVTLGGAGRGVTLTDLQSVEVRVVRDIPRSRRWDELPTNRADGVTVPSRLTADGWTFSTADLVPGDYDIWLEWGSGDDRRPSDGYAIITVGGSTESLTP